MLEKLILNMPTKTYKALIFDARYVRVAGKKYPDLTFLEATYSIL